MKEIAAACKVLVKEKFDKMVAKGIRPRAIRALIRALRYTKCW